MALVVDAASVRVVVSRVAADGLVDDTLTLAAQANRLGVRAQARRAVAVVARHAANAATADGKVEKQV